MVGERLVAEESHRFKRCAVAFVKNVFDIILNSNDFVDCLLDVSVLVRDHDFGHRGLESSEVGLLKVCVVLDAFFHILGVHATIQFGLTIVESLEEINQLSFWQAELAVRIGEIQLWL